MVRRLWEYSDIYPKAVERDVYGSFCWCSVVFFKGVKVGASCYRVGNQKLRGGMDACTGHAKKRVSIMIDVLGSEILVFSKIALTRGKHENIIKDQKPTKTVVHSQITHKIKHQYTLTISQTSEHTTKSTSMTILNTN
jgi:hypothetical protein